MLFLLISRFHVLSDSSNVAWVLSYILCAVEKIIRTKPMDTPFFLSVVTTYLHVRVYRPLSAVTSVPRIPLHPIYTPFSVLLPGISGYILGSLVTHSRSLRRARTWLLKKDLR